MSKPKGRIDLAKFRETAKEQRERARTGPQGHTIQSRAVIRLVEDQLKEARVGNIPSVATRPSLEGEAERHQGRFPILSPP